MEENAGAAAGDGAEAARIRHSFIKCLNDRAKPGEALEAAQALSTAPGGGYCFGHQPGEEAPGSGHLRFSRGAAAGAVTKKPFWHVLGLLRPQAPVIWLF